MDTDNKKSDFELIMEAIEALPYGSCERKHVDIGKIRVIGDREAFLKAIDKEGYQIKCVLGNFIDDLDVIFTYYVSTASATGDDRIKAAMNEAVKSLPVSLENILEMLFCICGCGLTAYDIGSIVGYIQELPDDISIDWGTVFDEDVLENELDVILVAAGGNIEV